MTTHPTVVRIGTTHRALPARWVVLACLSVLAFTFVGVLPEGVRTNAQLTELHLPDGWTRTELLTSLDQLGVSSVTLPLTSYLLFVVVGLLYLLTAYLIVRRAPSDPGALTVAILLGACGWALAGTHLVLAEIYPHLHLPLRVAGIVGFSTLILLLYVFPDGRFRPRWTVWAAAVTVVVSSLGAFDAPVSPQRWPLLWSLAFQTTALLLPVGVQVYRYRVLSDAAARRRTRAVAVSLALVVATLLLPYALLTALPRLAEPGPTGLLFYLSYNALGTLAVTVVPVVIAVAVLRLQLWDLDPVLNGALVYATLTALVVGVYAGTVVLLTQVFREPPSLWLAGLAAGVVALLFDPARRRVQRAVDRLMYGERDDPYTVLAGLGGRLEGLLAPEDVVHTLVTTVREALQLPWVRIDLLDANGQRVGTARTPAGAPSDEEGSAGRGDPTVEGAADQDVIGIHLAHRGETIARLTIPQPCTSGRRRAHDLRLVQDLCRQAGAAVYAARAAADLQRARKRVVTAREEERRRMRRDLHDGLGPSIAAVAMQLDTAEMLAERGPDRLPGLLAEARQDVSTLMASVRRLAHGLYPPALDQLGLAGALRDHADRCLTPAGVAVELQVENVPGDLAAAVESATYLIACEAMTNVERHAAATTCHVRVSCDDGSLRLEVHDDGTGIPSDRREGVGLQSMRERAEELGGWCQVKAGAGGTGTSVLLTLPLHPGPGS